MFPAAARDAGKVGKKNYRTFNFPQNTEREQFLRDFRASGDFCGREVDKKPAKTVEKSVCEKSRKTLLHMLCDGRICGKNLFFYCSTMISVKKKKKNPLNWKEKTERGGEGERHIN